jgi:hypothetical protein
MTESYFWRVAGRWSAPERTLELRDRTELYEAEPNDLSLLYQNSLQPDTATGGVTGLVLNKQVQGSPAYSFAFNGDNEKWLRVQATFHCAHREWDLWKMAQFVVRLVDKSKPGDSIVKENMIRVYRLLDGGETKNISLDMKLPPGHYDAVNILFWNGDSDKELIITDLKAWSFSK